MLVSNSKTSSIQVPILLWRRLLRDLRHRGAGRGESGAFLFGVDGKQPRRATTYVCYDDFDPNAYQRGAIAFHAEGYAALWSYCKDHKLEILADVHSHPGPDVRQSDIDQRHPMLPMTGHTGMIVPNYGSTSWWSLRGVGIYEYLGNFKWTAHSPLAKHPRIKLTLW